MARTPRVLDLEILLNADRAITGFSGTLPDGSALPAGVTITPADGDHSSGNPPLVNITLASQVDYDYLRFTPKNTQAICYPTTQFKFLGATLISDTIETTRGFKTEWRQPVFGLTDAKSTEFPNGQVSTMAIFIDDDLDNSLHNFSIMYWSSGNSETGSGSLQVWDPGITNEEN